MKKGLKKFTKILVLIAMIFSDLMTPIKVFANEISDRDPVKGDIGINNKVTNDGNSITVSSGSLDDEGDVLVTKTVSKTNTEGKYEVRFKIEGKDVTTTTTSTKPIYAVVVFDRSGSMYEEKCDFLFFGCKEVKYSSAVNGARTFAKTLLNKFSNANLSLVAFSTDVKVLTNPKGDGFVNGNFDSINFGNPDGVTNLTGALNKAKELLDAKTGDYTKYVVVISDGEPTNANGYVTTEAINQAIAAASEIKNSNIEIFSIGYETDRAASNVLKNISSGEGYYVNADPDTVAAKFSEITSNITSSTFAGTEAKLTDKIGSDFTVIPNDNITIDENGNVSANIGNITEGGTEVSFYVQIDGDNADGWVNVNEGFNLSYKNAQNEDDSLNYSQNNEQPQVYWVQNTYDYVVNYYKDSFNNLIKSETRKAANGTIINESNVDRDKYLPEGYEFNTINPNSITITNDGIVKEINILYTIKKFNYVVNYYYDDVLDSSLTINKTDIPYGTSVDSNEYYLKDNQIREGYTLDTVKSDNNTYIITNNDVVINIYYKKNSYGYSVNYFFNSEKGFTTNDTAIYGDKITAQSKWLSNEELSNRNKADYFLDPNKSEENNKEITIGTDKDKNVLDIYYINTNFNNTTETISKVTNTEKVTSSSQKVSYKVTYNTSINNVRKGDKVVVTITDTLPGSIIENESTLNGGVYNSTDNTITWTYTYNINEYQNIYRVSKEISYTVKYENYLSFNGNTLVNTANGYTTVSHEGLDNKVTEGKEDTATVPVEIKGIVTATYKTDKGITLHTDVTTTDLVGKEYTTEQKTFFGYTLKEIPTNKNGTYTKEDIIVNYVYTKNTGNIENPYTEKTGPDTINSVDGVFEYNITASGNVKEYVGNIKVNVKDILPYAIDEEKSTLDNRCTYDGNKTITCAQEYTNITEEDYTNGVYTVDETFNLKLVFIGIDSNKVVNKATSTIELDGTKKTTEDEKETEVYKGIVVATYKDENGNELHTNVTTTELSGTSYNTEEKPFYGYTLKQVPTNKEGKYVANQTIYVDYVYTKNIGTSEEELDKEGLEVVGSINDAFDYTITYNTTIKDYVGKATLVITDILPYKIDEEKSTISNNCKYEDGVITCTYTKDNSSVFAVRSIILDEEESRDIVFNIEENFKLYYINITDKEVTNKVTAELTYGETTKTTDDEYTTEVEESKVIVNYVTKDGTKLTDSIILTGLVGTTYETVKKEFDKYSFIEVIGEVEGSFTNEDKEVTYVYDLTILPPQTGIETNIFMYINYIFALLAIAVAVKTYKTIKNN